MGHGSIAQKFSTDKLQSECLVVWNTDRKSFATGNKQDDQGGSKYKCVTAVFSKTRTSQEQIKIRINPTINPMRTINSVV